MSGLFKRLRAWISSRKPVEYCVWESHENQAHRAFIATCEPNLINWRMQTKCTYCGKRVEVVAA